MHETELTTITSRRSARDEVAEWRRRSIVFAIVYGIIIIAHTLLTGIDVPGYATTIVVVLFLGGIQLLVMGILGEYLAKTYIQGKHRPVYVVKKVLEKKE